MAGILNERNCTILLRTFAGYGKLKKKTLAICDYDEEKDVIRPNFQHGLPQGIPRKK